MSRCRSCEADIVWVSMDGSGKKAPMNLPASPDGNIKLTGLQGRVLKPAERAEAIAAAEPLYLSHFATCPNSKEHRKPVDAHDSLFQSLRDRR